MLHELWELLGGEGEGTEQGVGSRSPTGTSVDGHLHHDHQKRDLQVSKKGWFIYARGLKAGRRGKQEGGIGQQNDIHESVVCICITAHECSHLMNIVLGYK